MFSHKRETQTQMDNVSHYIQISPDFRENMDAVKRNKLNFDLLNEYPMH